MLMKEDIGTVGHVPKKIKLSHSFIARGGDMETVIIGARHLLMTYHKVASEEVGHAS